MKYFTSLMSPKKVGYEARELEHSIFTEADSLEELKQQIKEAVHCQFG